MQRKLKLRIKILLFLISILVIALININTNLKIEEVINSYESKIEVLAQNELQNSEDQKNLTIKNNKLERSIIDESLQEIKITSYYPGDPCGSSNLTYSGLTTADFEINENGWYTYDGKIVIAASIRRFENDTQEDYKIYNIFDEVSIIINATVYQGIILDVCGASYRLNEKQIYDIYVSDEFSMVTGSAVVISIQ
ncbi:hypothetical protein [Clostridium sp.]|uniref:hypothetical protein n=1 Tax=Clostridium sp. TaxID=1506 RepID=UPI001A5E03D3|nr:hypothetical protein [Clostridium sp.]MBK5234039.1 hypothetical protein [Clostridium sp.]